LRSQQRLFASQRRVQRKQRCCLRSQGFVSDTDRFAHKSQPSVSESKRWLPKSKRSVCESQRCWLKTQRCVDETCGWLFNLKDASAGSSIYTFSPSVAFPERCACCCRRSFGTRVATGRMCARQAFDGDLQGRAAEMRSSFTQKEEFFHCQGVFNVIVKWSVITDHLTATFAATLATNPRRPCYSSSLCLK
jgi:hypothetical protein